MSADSFPISEIPNRLDELRVRYRRHNGAWTDSNVAVTLAGRLPSTVQLADGAARLAADTVVWRLTLLCPGKYNCTPKDAARAAKSLPARCHARLRIEVFVVSVGEQVSEHLRTRRTSVYVYLCVVWVLCEVSRCACGCVCAFGSLCLSPSLFLSSSFFIFVSLVSFMYEVYQCACVCVFGC